MRALLIAAAWIACACAASAQTGALPSWMNGRWLECAAPMTTSEMWMSGSDVMVGVSVAHGDGPTRWEQMRIELIEGRPTFFASPMGAPPVAFPAVEQASTRIVFENRAHDFPQRVIYERRGRRLIGRIEGVIDGALQEATWVYSTAAMNARCRY